MQGECESNPGYMHKMCRKSCDAPITNITILAGSCCKSWRPPTILCVATIISFALYISCFDSSNSTSSGRRLVSTTLRSLGSASIFSALFVPGITFMTASLDRPLTKIHHAFDVVDLIEDIVIQYHEPLIGAAVVIMAGSIAALTIAAAAVNSGHRCRLPFARMLLVVMGTVWFFSSALEGLNIPLLTHASGR